MFEFWSRLFDPTGFAPQAFGESWTPTLLWLHATSDLLIWLAFVSLPLILLYFSRRRDLPFSRLFVLFALFILACGTVHLLQALALEYPIHRFTGVMKAVTALLSWITVIALIPIIPRVMIAMSTAAKGTDTTLHRALSSSDRPAPLRPYLIAVLAAILALLARGAIDPLLGGDQLFVIALLAVVYISWQYGFRPAIVTLVLSVFGYSYFFVAPRYTFVVPELSNQLAVVLFFFCGVACAALGESQRVAQKRSREALAAAVARQEELVSEIVQRERIEEALRISERRFQDLVETLPQLVWTCHTNGECDYLSRQWVEYAGRSEAQMLRYGWLDSIHPADQERLADAWRAAVDSEEEFNIEYRIRRHDGVYRWFFTRAVLARNEYGLGEKWYGTNTDIEDRKRAEQDAAQLAAIVTSSGDAIISKDINGVITSWNRSAERLFGYTATEAIGRPVTLLIPPERLDEEPAILARIRRGETIEPYETVRRRKDGALIDVALTVSPMRDATGTVFGASKVVRDITDRKRAEEAVHASEVRFRTLTDTVPQMVWQADPQGQPTYFNRRWYEYTGRELHSRQSSVWCTDLLHPDDRERVLTTWNLAVVKQPDEYTEEFRLLRESDGEYRWLMSVAVPLRDSSGRVDEWVGTLTDIDDQKRHAETLERMVRERTVDLAVEIEERKAAEQQVRSIAAELQRSNGELEQFAYIASHDLQEPLRKIQAFGDRLVTKCRAELSDTGKEYVDRMLTAAGRMRRLIDDLLSFSRVTTQQREFTRIDFTKLVQEVVADLDERLLQTQGTVEVGPLPDLEADPSQMRQLFQNLIANAVKFHRPGVPPVVEIRGEIVTHPPATSEGEPIPMARVIVKDNGIGLDEKYLDRIFEVFQRLHGKHKYEGTGVGLAICRKIVERHSGTITAQSREGEGATFIVLLPLRQTE